MHLRDHSFRKTLSQEIFYIKILNPKLLFELNQISS